MVDGKFLLGSRYDSADFLDKTWVRPIRCDTPVKLDLILCAYVEYPTQFFIEECLHDVCRTACLGHD